MDEEKEEAMRTEVVLVNYYKEKELADFVRRYISVQRGCSLHVSIVDNGSHQPDVLAHLSREISTVTLHEPGSNTGYIGAARLVYESMDKGNLPDVFVLSNFDLSFDEHDFFRSLGEVFEETRAACVAPAIRSDRTGRNLNPFYLNRIPGSKMRRLIRITSWYPVYLLYQGLHILKSNADRSKVDQRTDIYAPHGSFIALHKSFFTAGGNLNFDSFLYGEELFIAEQMRVLGLRTVYEPRLAMTHEEHTTTGSVKSARHMRYLHQSLVYLNNTFFT